MLTKMLTNPTPTHTTPHHSYQTGPQETRGVAGGRDRDRTCEATDASVDGSCSYAASFGNTDVVLATSRRGNRDIALIWRMSIFPVRTIAAAICSSTS